MASQWSTVAILRITHGAAPPSDSSPPPLPSPAPAPGSTAPAAPPPAPSPYAPPPSPADIPPAPDPATHPHPPVAHDASAPVGGRPRGPIHPSRREPRWDLYACVGLALLAAVAAFNVPDGSGLRLLLVAPVLLFVPGYLALEATLPPAALEARDIRRLVSVGLSPPIVGLFALGTALFPDQFRPGPIVATVTVGCVLLASTAYVRRHRRERRPADGDPVATHPGEEEARKPVPSGT